MSFLAPWALVLGLAGAAAAVLLHLVGRQRAAAYLLPTARFLPERQTLVSRAVARPRDLVLLAVRVLLILCASAAFARPVLRSTGDGRARVVIVDQTRGVAEPLRVRQRATALATSGAATVTITFDSAIVVRRSWMPVDSSVFLSGQPSFASGTLTAALIVARREAASLARRADSVELVLLSPVAASQLDAAAWSVRALWPGTIRIERLPARVDSTAHRIPLERAVPLADPLGPALARLATGNDAYAVRVRRSARVTTADSAFARAGGVVLAWDSTSAPLSAAGLATGDDVVVAPLGRLPIPDSGTVRARWADGAPAAVEHSLGAGCIRSVGVALPASGDLPLRPSFQRLVRTLAGRCAAHAAAGPLADSAMVRRLAGTGSLASAAAFDANVRPAYRAVTWLLVAAIACALLELALRRGAARRATEAA